MMRMMIGEAMLMMKMGDVDDDDGGGDVDDEDDDPLEHAIK